MRPMRVLATFAFSLPILLGTAVLAAGPPVKLHGLAKEAFEKLPPDALLDVGGRVETKAQLLARVRPAASAKPALASLLDEVTAQIEREDKSKADQANAIVLGRARAMTVKTPASPLKPIEPHIAEVPFSAGPGYLVIVLGSGFGQRAGEVHLRFTNGGMDLPLVPPGARISAQAASQLESNRVWADDQVVAFVPSGVGGVVDQTAEVIVVTANGKRSAPAPIATVTGALRKRSRIKSASGHASMRLSSARPGDAAACEGRT